ncbi:MAG: hypothetical protein A2Z66_02950 [Chloroflexi bacterium RBG_13_66_10]|nr:MAG: hypothetical protein A2Z66_02950 [Chloroflexi bacterium RBG_13_66_10]
MSDERRAHLDPEMLQAMLDGVLTQKQVRRAEAHLAACAECSRNAAALQAVFASLAALRDEPLVIDLSPAVLARLRPHRLRRRLGGWLVAAQVAGAALMLGATWQWLAGILTPLGVPGLSALLAMGARVLDDYVNQMWNSVSSPVALGLESLSSLSISLPTPAIPLAQGVALVLAAAVLWFVGNGVLLRSRPAGQGYGDHA